MQRLPHILAVFCNTLSAFAESAGLLVFPLLVPNFANGLHSPRGALLHITTTAGPHVTTVLCGVCAMGYDNTLSYMTNDDTLAYMTKHCHMTIHCHMTTH
jgi:hypothetical protein